MKLYKLFQRIPEFGVGSKDEIYPAAANDAIFSR